MVDDGIESFFLYTKGSGAYRRYITDREFAKTWAPATKIVASNEKSRDRLREARANI